MKTPRFLLIAALLLASFTTACGDKKGPKPEEAAESPEKTSPDKGEATAPPDQAGSPGDNSGSAETDLQWQDSIRAVRAGVAYLVLESALGHDAQLVKQQRVSLAKAFAGLEVDSEQFASELIGALQGELNTQRGGRKAKNARLISNALKGAIGETKPRDFADAVQELHGTDSNIALIGALIELTHGLRALAAGAAPEGSPAFGVANALVCPDALWHEGDLFATLTAGSMPQDIDAMAELRRCQASCPKVDAATNIAELTKTLGHCPTASIPTRNLNRPEFEMPLTLLGLMAFGQVLDANARIDTLDWGGENALKTEVTEAVNLHLETLVLTADWPILSDSTPRYSHLTNELAKVTYLLDLTEEARFGVWPHKQLEDNQLNPAPFHHKSSSGALFRITLNTPGTLQPFLQPKFPSRVGIIVSKMTSMGTLRAGLRAVRAVDIHEKFLAVKDQEGALHWLPIDSNPDAEADALVQQSAAWVSLWINPGGVHAATMVKLSEPNPPGQFEHITLRSSVRDTFVALHDRFADRGISRVLVDLDDTATVSDLLDLLNLLDFPRSKGTASLAELLAAQPSRGVDAERLLESVFVTENRLSDAPAPAAQKFGVTMPTPNDISIMGPVSVGALVEGLQVLQKPFALCYAREQEGNPTLSGTVIVQLSLGPEGKISAVSTVENSTGSELLQACVEDGMDMTPFEVPEGNTELSVVKIPIRFDPPEVGNNGTREVPEQPQDPGPDE